MNLTSVTSASSHSLPLKESCFSFRIGILKFNGNTNSVSEPITSVYEAIDKEEMLAYVIVCSKIACSTVVIYKQRCFRGRGNLVYVIVCPKIACIDVVINVYIWVMKCHVYCFLFQTFQCPPKFGVSGQIHQVQVSNLKGMNIVLIFETLIT